jgi:ankyrin repeat protein
LDKAAAVGDVDLFNWLVSQGADPSRSEALHRASKCHDEAKSVAMVSCLIERHNMSMEAKLYAGYDNGLDRGPERGTPLCCAIFNRNMPVAAELMRLGGNHQDLGSAISTAVGGSRIEYFEPALLLLLEVGGADAQQALRQSVSSDNLSAATLSLKYGADAALALREQIEENKLALAQDLNPPKAVEDVVYHREMSQDMKGLLEDWVAQRAAVDEASRL